MERTTYELDVDTRYFDTIFDVVRTYCVFKKSTVMPKDRYRKYYVIEFDATSDEMDEFLMYTHENDLEGCYCLH